MGKRNLYLLHTILLVFVIGLNCWIYFSRDNGYAYQEFASFAQLYELNTTPRITDLITRQDSLELVIKPVPGDSIWKITKGNKLTVSRSIHPIIQLESGKHEYTVTTGNPDSSFLLTVGINVTPESTYTQNKRTRESVTELYACNIPVGNYKTWSINDWQRISPYSQQQDEVLAKQWIKQYAGIVHGDSTLRKTEKIARALLKQLDASRGIPEDSMDLISPYRQFTKAIHLQSKLWCGNFTAIVSYFLEVEGIASREVCLEGKLNSVYTTGHSLNEVFIPELNTWVMVDLTSKAVLVSFKGKYLNLLDLYTLHQQNADLKVSFYQKDSISTCSYDTVRPFYDAYFNIPPRFVYYFNNQYQPNTYGFLTKWKRYFFERPTFVTYSGTVDSSNKKFYYKQMAAAGLLLFLVYLLVLVIVRRISKNQYNT